MTEKKTGYGAPPKSTRFIKGKSGNPRGRPKGSRKSIPHERVLGQMVTVVIDGREERMTATEAFLLRLTQNGLSGNSSSARMALDVLEKARKLRERLYPDELTIKVQFRGAGVEHELEGLGIVTNKYTTDESRVRTELNPWIVERALERLDWNELSEEEQRDVWDATRMRHKVKWPDWWTYRPT